MICSDDLAIDNFSSSGDEDEENRIAPNLEFEYDDNQYTPLNDSIQYTRQENNIQRTPLDDISQNLEYINEHITPNTNDSISSGNQQSHNNDSINFHNLVRADYTYYPYKNIRNYWAGPSYWKITGKSNSQSSNQSTENAQAQNSPRPIRNRQRQQAKKIEFMIVEGESDDENNDEVDAKFISIRSRLARKIRKCRLEYWSAARLKFPPKLFIPNDIFDKYKFQPSYNNDNNNNVNDYLDENQNIEDNDEYGAISQNINTDVSSTHFTYNLPYFKHKSLLHDNREYFIFLFLLRYVSHMILMNLLLITARFIMIILKWVKLVKFLKMLLFRYVIKHVFILPFIFSLLFFL